MTRISGTGNTATLAYTDDDGNRVTVEFWAPTHGGYVRDVTYKPGTLGNQVCDGLEGGGHALTWNGRGNLASLIRREWKAKQAREKRERADDN